MLKRRSDAIYLTEMGAFIARRITELGWGIYEKFDTMQLPNFIQWKNLGAGEYVMGLEVSNSFPDGRDKERAQGRLPFIEPGETKTYCFELGIVDGDAEISALKAEIASYR